MSQLIYEELRKEFLEEFTSLLNDLMEECGTDKERVATLELFVDDIEAIADSYIDNL